MVYVAFFKAINAGDIMEANNIVTVAAFLERDSAGRTAGERFVDAGMPELNNDQELLFKAKMATRPALLEVHEVIDSKTIRAVDLLRPEEGEFLVVDKALAGQAVRFEAILVFPYALPGFKRIHGAGYNLRDFGEITPLRALNITIQHAGGPANGTARDEFLFRESARIVKILADSWQARLQQAQSQIDGPTDDKRVAKELLEHPNFDLPDEMDKKFLETPLENLGGLSPRQAAQSPEQRPKLIEFMKRYVRLLDLENLRFGGTDSIDWALKDLGLEEILFPAPPARPVPEAWLDDEGALDDEGELDAGEFDENLRPAPELPPEPISPKQVEARVNELMDMSDRGIDIKEEFARCGGEFPSEIAPIWGRLLNERESAALEMAVAHATFTMLPMGHLIPEVLGQFVEDDLKELMLLGTGISGEEATIEWLKQVFETNRQPGVVKVIGALLIHLKVSTAEISDKGLSFMLLFLAAYVNELDRQLRPDLPN